MPISWTMPENIARGARRAARADRRPRGPKRRHETRRRRRVAGEEGRVASVEVSGAVSRGRGEARRSDCGPALRRRTRRPALVHVALWAPSRAGSWWSSSASLRHACRHGQPSPRPPPQPHLARRRRRGMAVPDEAVRGIRPPGATLFHTAREPIGIVLLNLGGPTTLDDVEPSPVQPLQRPGDHHAPSFVQWLNARWRG